MSLFGTILGAVAGPIIGGLFGMGSSVASAKMEYAQTKEGQERQYKYNKLLNADSYNYQTKLNTTAYNRQKALNKQAYDWQTAMNTQAYKWQKQLDSLGNQYAKDQANYSQQLTQQQNQWNALNLPSLNRQGYESAGINPMLAINSSAPAQMISASGVSGGSAPNGSAPSGSAPSGSAPSSSVGGAIGAKMDLFRGVTDAYRTFKLDTESNLADIALKKAQTENTNAKTITEGYNQDLLSAEKDLNVLEQQLKKKDLKWYDRKVLQEIESMRLGSLAQMISANASAQNAHTAHLQLGIDRYNAITNRHNYKLQKAIHYKDTQANRYWNSSDILGHFRHSIRESIRTLLGR